MKSAFLDEADPAAVSHAVRDVLERRGALVTEHIHSRVRFRALPTGSGWSWSRGGYVGIYQPYGEKDVEVRLVLRARWPHRILWTVAVLNVVIALLAFIVNPPGTTWFVLAFLCGLALLVAGIVYTNTWSSVRDQEASLMTDFDKEFQRERVAARVEDEEERRLHDAERALAGEVERARIERERAAHPKEKRKKEKAPKAETPAEARSGKLGLKLSFGRKKDAVESEAEPPGDESPEAKRARLLALKAELERKRDQGDEPKP